MPYKSELQLFVSRREVTSGHATAEVAWDRREKWLPSPLASVRLPADQFPSQGACRGHPTLEDLVPSLDNTLMTSSAGCGVHQRVWKLVGFPAPPGLG